MALVPDTSPVIHQYVSCPRDEAGAIGASAAPVTSAPRAQLAPGRGGRGGRGAPRSGPRPESGRGVGGGRQGSADQRPAAPQGPVAVLGYGGGYGSSDPVPSMPASTLAQPQPPPPSSRLLSAAALGVKRAASNDRGHQGSSHGHHELRGQQSHQHYPQSLEPSNNPQQQFQQPQQQRPYVGILTPQQIMLKNQGSVAQSRSLGEGNLPRQAEAPLPGFNEPFRQSYGGNQHIRFP